MMRAAPDDPGPLSGIRVIDLSRLLPGPFCSWYLASLGAEVIRVEPTRPGFSRSVPPLVEGESLFFAAINRGKRSVSLEWRADAGRAALSALISTADVVIEGFKPGQMAASGMDPEALIARNPRLIVASISGYGWDGPLRDAPGHDVNYLGYTGLIAALRDNDGAGVDPLPVQIADVAGGALTAALGICASLVGERRGRWLDISMTDGSLALMAPALAFAGGGDPRPGGELLTGAHAPYRTYRCQDGELLCVGALELKFWLRLREALGDELGTPPDPTPEALAAIFKTRPRDVWVALLQGCCVSPALRGGELAEHPLHRARGNFEPVLGAQLPRAPFPWSPLEGAPALGAHTREVLAPLGVDVDALIAAGIARG